VFSSVLHIPQQAPLQTNISCIHSGTASTIMLSSKTLSQIPPVMQFCSHHIDAWGRTSSSFSIFWIISYLVIFKTWLDHGILKALSRLLPVCEAPPLLGLHTKVHGIMWPPALSASSPHLP
jgi:hypothetical protein